jgi:hypothetical protein
MENNGGEMYNLFWYNERAVQVIEDPGLGDKGPE